jgi:cell division protein FtsW
LTADTVSKRIPPSRPETVPTEEHEPQPRRRYRSFRLKDRQPLLFHLVWIISLLLLVGGLCMLLSVSTAVAKGDKFIWVKNQGITAVVGVAVLMVLAWVDYRRLRAISVVLLGVTIFSLFLVHVPHVARVEGGAGSYIPIGPFTYQPSEVAKLAVVLLGAHVLTSPRVADRRFMSFMVPFGLCGVAMCGLVAWEHDLGTAIIIAGLMIGMLWIGGIKGGHLAAIGGVGLAGAGLLIFTSTERVSRVLSFLDPGKDPGKSSYQLNQALIALGRGGWFGVGAGQSVQKYQYLPEARSDMIFAIMGEEFGLAGAGFVIVLFTAFAVVCWRLARRCADPMGKLLIAGCGMLITLEAAVNIGGVIGALPLTGVPLPFISYGRNSLIVMLAAVGLILSVCRRAQDIAVRSEGERIDNVTSLDRRRWNSGARSARAGAR